MSLTELRPVTVLEFASIHHTLKQFRTPGCERLESDISRDGLWTPKAVAKKSFWSRFFANWSTKIKSLITGNLCSLFQGGETAADRLGKVALEFFQQNQSYFVGHTILIEKFISLKYSDSSIRQRLLSLKVKLDELEMEVKLTKDLSFQRSLSLAAQQARHKYETIALNAKKEEAIPSLKEQSKQVEKNLDFLSNQHNGDNLSQIEAIKKIKPELPPKEGVLKGQKNSVMVQVICRDNQIKELNESLTKACMFKFCPLKAPVFDLKQFSSEQVEDFIEAAQKTEKISVFSFEKLVGIYSIAIVVGHRSLQKSIEKRFKKVFFLNKSNLEFALELLANLSNLDKGYGPFENELLLIVAQNLSRIETAMINQHSLFSKIPLRLMFQLLERQDLDIMSESELFSKAMKWFEINYSKKGNEERMWVLHSLLKRIQLGRIGCKNLLSFIPSWHAEFAHLPVFEDIPNRLKETYASPPRGLKKGNFTINRTEQDAGVTPGYLIAYILKPAHFLQGPPDRISLKTELFFQNFKKDPFLQEAFLSRDRSGEVYLEVCEKHGKASVHKRMRLELKIGDSEVKDWDPRIIVENTSPSAQLYKIKLNEILEKIPLYQDYVEVRLKFTNK